MDHYPVWTAFLDEIPCDFYALYLEKDHLIFSNYDKEWVDLYQKNHYQNVDYPVLMAQKGPLPILWSWQQKKGVSSSQKEIFLQAHAFRIRYGISLPLMKEKGLISIASEKESLFKDYGYLTNMLMFFNHLLLFQDELTPSDAKHFLQKFKKQNVRLLSPYLKLLVESSYSLGMGRFLGNMGDSYAEEETPSFYLQKSHHSLDEYIDKFYRHYHS